MKPRDQLQPPLGGVPEAAPDAFGSGSDFDADRIGPGDLEIVFEFESEEDMLD